ncbi:urease accessory protein UreF [Sulfitobacter albidus]|uniref:Urease accessory protein UreF n=1 Tax=Sulfitobacter albidus TaxID=2829501 RepID=A0A975PMW4_9RHOB|nr:urease accessory UreF family protein [Sulfitobacter albidus]QUJ77237.1 urease accessory protein UreF [Sulfitobacter albidus]
MSTEATLILTQWMSPAYPLGSFAYSHGMETEIAARTLHDAAGVQAWIGAVLRHGAGQSDAVLLRAGFGSDASGVREVDAIARAYAGSAERLEETVQQGVAFALTTSAIWGIDVPPLTHPVAVGYAAGQMDLPLDLTVTMYLQSFAANLVSCAVRAVPLGQTEGQRMTATLVQTAAEVATASAGIPLEDLGACAFAADIAAMRHETLEPRIFRT